MDETFASLAAMGNAEYRAHILQALDAVLNEYRADYTDALQQGNDKRLRHATRYITAIRSASQMWEKDSYQQAAQHAREFGGLVPEQVAAALRELRAQYMIMQTICEMQGDADTALHMSDCYHALNESVLLWELRMQEPGNKETIK